jgi:hypothetical protein
MPHPNNSMCDCKACRKRRREGRRPLHNSAAIITDPDYTPLTLNELLANEVDEEQDRDASRARLKGGKGRGVHSHDGGESPLEGNFEIAGGERHRGERFGDSPNHMTSDDILEMMGLSERHLDNFDLLDDDDEEEEEEESEPLDEAETRALDAAYGPADEPVRRDARRRVGRVSPGPNRLRGQVVQNVQQTPTGFTAIPEAARRELLPAAT